MLVVPVQAVPRQELQAQLGGQNVSLTIAQNFYGLFMDTYLNGGLVVGGVTCQNLNRCVRMGYTGFLGDLVFFDTEGTDDPIYTGLGTRWVLLYFTQDELVGLQ